MTSTSIMAQEAASSPSVIAEQLSHNQVLCRSLAQGFANHPPRAIMMIGRGTSDHAGVFAKYLFEIGCQIPVISAAPSVAGIFNSCLKLEGCLAIAISQSGQSPDILHQTKLAKQGGAFTLALVNDEASPLAKMCDAVLPVCAGQEKAVAATKSYLATLSALVHLFSQWCLIDGGDATEGEKPNLLAQALTQLPEQMRQTQALSPLLQNADLKDVAHCVVLGRGFGYAIALEAALKLKEVLGIQAEAFSSAEFVHGPVTLVHKKLCVLNICIDDESAQGHRKQIEDVKQRGGRVIDITVKNTSHPRLHALLIMQRFYLDLERVAIERGQNPDAPIGLKKVTETV
ncbi:glucosamine-6-phosphate deaminase NagB-II [Glaciecola siphonariae]|uniref:Glucosamine-6-phosphate deaminase NagB-II n=1 Tax=Glaciecola siphonariae TaxID=521012 RepID=A0ABV9LZB8_9ALTE